MPEPIIIPLRSLGGITWSQTRRREPITVGVPLPRSVVRQIRDITLQGPSGPVPCQVRSLDTWSDGSIRWALIDGLVDADAGQPHEYAIRIDSDAGATPETNLRVSQTHHGARIETGRATLDFTVGGVFPFSSISAGRDRPAIDIDVEASGLLIEQDGETHRCTVTDVSIHESGPLRAAVEVRGRVGSAPNLEVVARVQAFADTATVKLDVTLRNPRRALHPSGRWPLGDKGSVFVRSSTLAFALSQPISRVTCAAEPGMPVSAAAMPFEVLQESSGGDRWNGPVHVNRNGEVPLRFRGYRLQADTVETFGTRASPIVIAESGASSVAVAVPHFWQNFPQAVSVAGSRMDIAFWPATADLHELQGGEQKTHRVVVAFAPDDVSDTPLAWVHDPIQMYPAPEWCCRTEAVPFLAPHAIGADPGYLSIVDGAFDSGRGFFAKRELADEFGWRNFGDLPADHESAFQPPGTLIVSHYNNQYDAIAAFAMHFLRTGDARWRTLCDDLARHVRDIDIYRTTEDKSAYNGGLFWHTNHYVDAGTSTHRTYPSGGSESGGPAAEHNYNIGLMWHYFMTGDPASRDAAIGLGRWVLNMDDGRRTPFRWLAGGATGLASATGSMTYHGPGRGAANSILACLAAFQLTGDADFRNKADELIRRCVHPNEDLAALNLLDVERRWYYTVFLQALGWYLHAKQERQELDEAYAYAKASLLHYARWMAGHERPFLSRPEVLEFPNETWPAQDIRKAEIFAWAALHGAGDERPVFRERANFFFRYSVDTLTEMPGRFLTRPLVLMLSNGARYASLNQVDLPDQTDLPNLSNPSIFEPQKVRAIRRAKWLGIGAIAMALIAALAMFAASR